MKLFSNKFIFHPPQNSVFVDYYSELKNPPYTCPGVVIQNCKGQYSGLNYLNYSYYVRRHNKVKDISFYIKINK